ncbi:synaptic vesicular amine transporter [Toxorhynchites rutilus septentrionalis]|uniref:synaptic vesicular amine transporter n=1 Tax=Toxorhynchites rutilus septentrionalis TaxID=329112 RepID=UPI0024790172|nr:synaptic vesicular amine transporter [Toxorhynchites rutilus septentrionalis]
MFSFINEHRRPSRTNIAFIIYISLFLDNMLLTVIVPILPDYLVHFYSDSNTSIAIPKSVIYKKFDFHYVPKLIGATKGHVTLENLTITDQATLETENGSIGILLAVKALVQLVFNPIVGNISSKIGYSIPIAFGTMNLLIASIIFALGESYVSLFIARAIHGVGSACISVCGMSLVAQMYIEPEKRSKIMGTILGSIAVGVLVGYPFGGIVYDIAGKDAPFYILTVLTLTTFIMQLCSLDFSVRQHMSSLIGDEGHSKWLPLLMDRLIIIVVGCIWISTSAMSILEPCLPLWMMEKLHPKKWQLGTVFIPDSIGYWIGTNFFGGIAYKFGQIKIAIVALILVGISCIMIPSANAVFELFLPHFGLGLGIGILDASLVPLLATLVDSQCGSDNESDICEVTPNYGAVYAIQQIAVSLAYSLAPIVGGELVPLIGFPWLMRIMGIANLMYGPLLIYSGIRESVQKVLQKQSAMPLTAAAEFTAGDGNYKRFYNTVD